MMHKISAAEFAKKLFEMEDDTKLNFMSGMDALGDSFDEEDYDPFLLDTEYGWFFAKKVYWKLEASWFILLDFYNGGQAHVIPLDWASNYDDNMEIIKNNVDNFCSAWLKGIWVEDED